MFASNSKVAETPSDGPKVVNIIKWSLLEISLYSSGDRYLLFCITLITYCKRCYCVKASGYLMSLCTNVNGLSFNETS